jgi:DNA repair protein RecN (Recombination protein N)
MEALENAHLALSGDVERDGASSLLSDAEYALSTVGGISDEISNLSQRVSELRYAADDVAELVRDARAGFDFSPGELDELEERLDLLYRLKKKYGDSVAAMLAYLDKCRNELESIRDSDDTIARLQKKLDADAVTAAEKGRALSQARRKAALKLQERIRRELEELDMPRVRFEVDFASKKCEGGMDADGMDAVQFLMSANMGEQLRPIQKIASGGELARIMLALKNVLAENDDVTTLVFDEVDSGVSGRAAMKVAEKMSRVARSKQVLCVTHLPQIAAMADIHFSVEKGERNGRTFTDVERLGKERRKEELARLTGGERVTASLLQSAEELLDAAQSYKKRPVDK